MENVVWSVKRSGAAMTLKLEYVEDGSRVEQTHTNVELISFAGDRIIAALADGSQLELPTTQA